MGELVVNLCGYEVMIDEEDRQFVDGKKWQKEHDGRHVYFRRHMKHPDGRRYMVALHREIMGLPELCVDHINGDTLDNRRSNLRICTKAQNTMNRGPQKNNTSGFKGVSFNKQSGKWISAITVNNKRINIGLFPSAKEAHIAYCEKAKELHGEYARFE